MIINLAKANNSGFLCNPPAKAGGKSINSIDSQAKAEDNTDNCFDSSAKTGDNTNCSFILIVKTGENSNYLNCPDIYVGNNKKVSRIGFSQNNNSFNYSINSYPSNCKLMEGKI